MADGRGIPSRAAMRLWADGYGPAFIPIGFTLGVVAGLILGLFYG